MPVELKIPTVGESITEVQIGNWLKKEGDTVRADEPVAVIDSEKTTFELPAPQSGKLAKILHNAGDTVRVGTVIGRIEPSGETEKARQPDEPERSATKPSTAVASIDTPPGHKENDGAESAKPPEQDSAKSAMGVSSPNAAPQKSSAEDPTHPPVAQPPKRQAADESTKFGPDREERAVPMTMLRRTVARRLVEAQQNMAMLTTFNEVDMSAVLAVRKEHQEEFQKRYQVKLGLMSFFVRAAIDALEQFPQLNAEIRGDDIVYRNYFDIAVAIATDRGLVVPVLRNVEWLSFSKIERTIGDFAHRAKDGKLKPDELEGGTFTITNGGVFGSLLSTPIINPPQAGVLGMHAIQERPIAIRGQVAVRPMMYLALTYDHRLVDGREAVLFQRRIKEAIENPVRMLIEA